LSLQTQELQRQLDEGGGLAVKDDDYAGFAEAMLLLPPLPASERSERQG